MALLPASTNFTGSSVTQAGAKAFVSTLRTYLADLLGTDSGDKPAALAALGAAPLNSPVLTGNPVAPNPATGDRSTAIATMRKFDDEFNFAPNGNGYQKLPSGIIIKWGTVSTIAGVANVVYPIAFPSVAFVVVATTKNGGGGAGAVVTVVSSHASSFGIHTQFWASGVLSNIDIVVDYIAIGY